MLNWNEVKNTVEKRSYGDDRTFQKDETVLGGGEKEKGTKQNVGEISPVRERRLALLGIVVDQVGERQRQKVLKHLLHSGEIRAMRK